MPTGYPTVVVDGKRTCIRCGKPADESEFAWKVRSEGTHRNTCLDCWKNYWAGRREIRAEQKRKRYANSTPEQKAAEAEKRRKKGYPPRDSIAERCRKHHITVEFYYELLESQNGVCPICERELTPDVTPCLDHDHNCCNNSGGTSCGHCVRGILCARCNKGLGCFEKFPKTMMDYIERTSI